MSRYKPIGDYGLIGNRRTAALVGMDGSIDWFCPPRFDSPSVFAAILDADKGGRFAINPDGRYTRTQRYLGDTNVLETRFETEEGIATVTDCMPLYQGPDGVLEELHQIIRRVRCEKGSANLRVMYAPRPDYARAEAQLSHDGGTVVWRDGDIRLTLDSPVPLAAAGGQARGTFSLREGDEALFVLSYTDATTTMEQDGLSPQDRLERTIDYWRIKGEEVDCEGPWRSQVARSYLALHLLTHRSTGGIAAAPTTSLPEEIGGVRNWDYRYTWLRDAAFTVEALLSLGHRDEAMFFFQWLGHVCATYGKDIGIMYRVDGADDLEEEELVHLEGYLGSRPVRIGNGAHRQSQHDIYGEVLASAHLLFSNGTPISDDQWEPLRTLANLAQSTWHEPDSGIWEVRGGPYHFVYSKVTCWVALDRAVALAESTGRAGPEREGWKRTAHAIKEEVLQLGWSDRKQAFVQHYDTDAMDASNLLIPLMGFLPIDDPRVVSTVQRIRQELGPEPLLRRYLTDETDDGLTGNEGAFTLCGFWLVQVISWMGEMDEASRLFWEIIGYANHLGLFSEMIDTDTGVALGNFPQAFTHIGLILAARDCDIGMEPT